MNFMLLSNDDDHSATGARKAKAEEIDEKRILFQSTGFSRSFSFSFALKHSCGDDFIVRTIVKVGIISVLST